MAKQTINTIKNWFRTGSKPTQAQFWDWLDSFFHKDDNIPSAQVEGLQGLLDAKMDKKDATGGSNSGPYDPLKNYVYSETEAEYVSYINAESTDTFFKSENGTDSKRMHRRAKIRKRTRNIGHTRAPYWAI